MSVAVELETVIGRPPADVYAALLAVEQFPEWLVASGIVAVDREERDAGPIGLGTRLRIGHQIAGRSTVLDASITELEADHVFAIHGRDRDGVSIEIEARLTPEGTGTRLRWSLRLGLPLRYRMFESMVAPQVRRAVTLDIEGFRRQVEGSTSS